MKPIKKIISDALSGKDEVNIDKNQLTPEVQTFIKKEIESQIQIFLRESLLPEIRKAVAETLQEEIQRLNLPVNNLQGSTRKIADPHQEELPLVLEEDILPLDEKLAEIQHPMEVRDTRRVVSFDEIRLGIDFGTTTTAVSMRIGDEQPQVLPIGRNGESFMPSLVYFRQGNGELADRILIGEDAAAMSLNDADRVIRSIKRCFACDGTNCSLEKEKNGTDFPWCNGKGQVRVSATETLLPSDVSFFIIQEALSRAVNIIKENNNVNLDLSNIRLLPINMGCGAKFNLVQRQVMLSNAQKLGIADTMIQNIVEEPILAGLAFSRFVSLTESVGRTLIYDFGGGTLDIAVIDVVRKDEKPLVTVLSTSGDNWLGGDDIDNIVFKEFISQIAKKLDIGSENITSQLTLVDRAKLLGMAKTAKERLSNSDLFRDSLNLESFGLVILTLTRDDFEFILEDSKLIDRSMFAMLNALKLAFALDIARESDLLNVDPIRKLRLEEAVSKVDRVVLVGGVTKIPYIQRRMQKLFGSNKVVEEHVFDPISAVSIGAAYPKEAEHFSISSPPYGFFLEGNQAGKIKREALLTSYTYLEFFGELYINSIPSFGIPFEVSELYSSVALKGERPLTNVSEKITDLDNLEPGHYRFRVELDGSLSLEKNNSRTKMLGLHPYRHPLQNQIKEEKDRRKAEANKPPSITLAQGYINGMNEN